MKDIKPLTYKQKEVLDFINQFLRSNGYSPSLKDIAKFVGTNNLSTAQYYVVELERKGHLKKDSNKSRGITPLSGIKSIQLLGYIAAGKPIEPIENPEEINVPENIKIDPNYPHYALRVKGDSMIDMGILDGDIALIRHQLIAIPGDIVVGITEHGATLKELRLKNGKYVLIPKNKKYGVIVPESLEIRGKFVGLIRPSN